MTYCGKLKASLQEYKKCGVIAYLLVFSLILDSAVITQLNRRFSHVSNLRYNSKGNCFEEERLNQLNSMVSN